MNPLQATIEEFAADGYTHVECYCPRCRVTRLRPISWLPRISLGLNIAELSARLRCTDCGGLLHSVKPWRMEDGLASPWGEEGERQAIPIVLLSSNSRTPHLERIDQIVDQCRLCVSRCNVGRGHVARVAS